MTGYAQSMVKKRDHYVDLGKGILISMVVMIHLVSMLPYSIEVFVVPCFFVLSGMYYNEHKSLRQWLLEKTQTILWPYLLWGMPVVFYSLFWWFFHFDMKYAEVVSNSSVHNHPLWFLGSLFMVSVAFKLLFMVTNTDKVLCFLCALIGAIVYFVRDYTTFNFDSGIWNLAYNVNVAFLFWPIYMPLYALGYMLKKYNFFDYRRYGMDVLIIAILLQMSATGVNEASFYQKNVFVYYSWVILLIFAFIYILRMFESNLALEYIGRSSLEVLCIHEYIYFIVRKLEFIDKVPQFLLIIALCLLASYFLNKYTPGVFSLKRRKQPAVSN